MLKAKIIMTIVRIVMGATALGLGIWYISKSIGGGAITYTSLDSFLNVIGVQNGDIASANGCFLCGYIEKLFTAIGNATEMFWTAMLDNIWILMAIGFGIFMFLTTANYLYEASKKNAALDTSERKIEFKDWFDKVWKQGARVMIVGVLIGAIGWGGTSALKTVANVTITPVMFIGTELSMAATGVSDSARCGSGQLISDGDVLNPVLKPFMCVMGNLNTVMLAGAAGGFALMNYAWMDMGGGAFTWIAGLALLIMFLIIGFDLFFQVLTVIFQLVFLIIFLPLLLAAAAFEPVWKIAAGVISNAIGMLLKCAVRVVGITLKILIIYGTVSFAADEYFPGPNDGYNAILPPITIAQNKVSPDSKTLSVMSVFSKCEQVAMTDKGLDKDKFKNCFTAQRAEVERRYPGAFDFMKDGWEFLLLMMGLFFLYYYAISPRVDKLLNISASGISDTGGKIKVKEEFDYGNWVRELGGRVWNVPKEVADKITKAATAKD